MNAQYPFVKSIQINKVRHLENIPIALDETRPRHLILTGPNGSGKTSLLLMLKAYLEGVPSQHVLQIEDWKNQICGYENSILGRREMLSRPISDNEKARLQAEIANYVQTILHLNAQIAKFNAVVPAIHDLPQLVESYLQGKFLISHFDAKRSSVIQGVSGAQKLNLPTVSPIAVSQQSVGSRFLQFLVNQENRAALLLRKGDHDGVAQIQAWMDGITQKFRELFQSPELTLDYDIDNFDFSIHIPGREPFRLVNNQLSDGYSAVIQIVAELLMRMEAGGTGSVGYNMPGIVLIDEIETHLHIKLQKTILPFLTAFFPHIQFIVTTHSPFVLTSLPDAVIFDLESQRRWENIMPLSAGTVVEDYFELDLYSEEIKRLMSRLGQLVANTNRHEAEQQELEQICSQLDGISYEQAPELVAQYHALRAQETAR